MASAADDSIPRPDAKRIDALVAQLGSKDFQERERASKELIAFGEVALPRLTDASKSPDLEIARRAKDCLKAIAHNAIVDCLIAELKSPGAKSRAEAAYKLSLLRDRAERAVATLLQALEDPDKNVRIRVICSLGQIGPKAAPAVPRLTELLNDPDTENEVRSYAANFALANMGKPAESAVPELLGMLEEKDPFLRYAAAWALGKLGHHHKDVVPALLRAMNTKDDCVLGPAAEALGVIGKEPERCIPALLQALQQAKGKSWGTYDPRPGIMYGLVQFGPATQHAIPTMVALAADENEGEAARRGAVQALWTYWPDTKDELQGLMKRVRNIDVRTELGIVLDHADKFPPHWRR